MSDWAILGATWDGLFLDGPNEHIPKGVETEQAREKERDWQRKEYDENKEENCMERGGTEG